MGVDRVFVGDERAGVVERNPQDVWLAVARNHVFDVLWIEVLKFLNGNPDKVADLLEVEILADLKGVDLDRHLDAVGGEPIFLTVLYRIHRPDKGRDITSCLTGEIVVDRPEIPAPATADGLVDIAGAAVVG